MILEYFFNDVKKKENDGFDIETYLNKKNSTRDLSDKKFQEILPLFAESLESFPFGYNYTEKQMSSDWEKLKEFTSADNFIAPQKRNGLRILEHYMDNLWDVKDYKGNNFRSCWNSVDLKKAIKLNRKMHSTPYLSEIRRMIYFTTGLPKTTMYRPTLTKLICDKYDVEYVLDPCIGWGGRMLGVCANPGRKYIGFEPSTRMYDNLLKIVKFLGIEKQVTILNKGAENIPNVIKDKWIDLIITSPPYYNLEIYSDENTQSYTGQSYKDWLNNFFKKIVNFSLDVLRDGGYSCWNVADIHSNKKYRFVKDTENIHKERGFSLLEKFGIISSKRPTSNISSEKSLDTTYTFKQI